MVLRGAWSWWGVYGPGDVPCGDPPTATAVGGTHPFLFIKYIEDKLCVIADKHKDALQFSPTPS